MDSVPLCLTCGLCCDGSLFSDVRLTREDVVRLGVEGARATHTRKTISRSAFRQPCAALHEGLCAVYQLRPGHCRNFDCALLQRNVAGEISREDALRIITRCRAHAARARKLLTLLGESREDLSLQKRFRRAEKIALNSSDEAALGAYAELTIVMHKLHCLLAKEIYPE